MPAQVTSSRVLLLGTETNGVVAGVTTGTSRPIPRPLDGILSVYLRSIGTTSGGTILIEECDPAAGERSYSGTWSVIATVAASSFTGGAQSAYHVMDSAYGEVRVRISSDITGGGSITAVMRSRGAA